MTSAEQLEQWVAGNSIHNNHVTIKVTDKSGKVVGTREIDGGECCPDFSCCSPELKWDEETRKAFAKARAEKDQDTVERMLVMSIGQMIARKTDKKVHVVDPDQHKDNSRH